MRALKLLSLAIIILISCNKTSVQTNNYYVAFKATLNGAGEAPTNLSTASGTASAVYNKNTGILTVNVTWSGLTAIAAHIHTGAVGVSGAIIFTFPNLTSPINYTSVSLTAAQEKDLLANLYYVDIHSAAYSNGEIRGQLIMQ
ncbi:MAG TPA: CHRD domain-containing protein [Chitinophagaceae bacterium]